MEACVFKEGEGFLHIISRNAIMKVFHRSDRGEFAGNPTRRRNVLRPEAPSEGRGEAVSKEHQGRGHLKTLTLAIFNNVILKAKQLYFLNNVIPKCS